MKKILPMILSAILAGAMIFASACAVEEPETEDNVPEEGFYGVSPELTAKLEQIVLSNAEIQGFIKDKVYVLVVKDTVIMDKNYILSVGVRLKDDITEAQFLEWVQGGRQDSVLVKEYVGVLNVGYNDRYDFKIDTEKGTVSEIIAQKGYGNIPEVTQEEEQRALDIALADATVQQILEGKKYQIAPDSKIGVWHDGDTKLGVSFQIDFEEAYTIALELPKYNSNKSFFTGEIGSIIIDVLLKENRVATIIPAAPLDYGD